MRKLTHEEIVARQNAANHPCIPLTVVLNNIRSLHNVGSIFRTADGAGVEKIWLCGITGFPPDSQISKTALGAEARVPWDHEKDAVSVIRRLKKEGYQIVLLEQVDRSIDYWDFKPVGRVCLIVGNEIEGISEELVALSDAAIEIEMAGLKNSLNVAVAFGVVAYHMRCHLKKNLPFF
ncbi:MAG: RNA methyltransferase [Candidatus Omnitrophica bacterium]|nr:RNA methyltransferase [Candidatus Omnitrophota bacterium]